MPVTETGQGGTLATTHAGKPGLPRGRSHLPPATVRASQRERLLRSVIAAVSESGYRAVTVADIVRGAKVSRAAFYAHFADKEECFLAATADGREHMIAQVISAARGVPATSPDEDVLRAACRAYLAFLAGEPSFTKVFYIHMPAAGPRAVDRLDAAPGLFADLNQRWHERAREHHPDWPPVPVQVYLALAGATDELVRSMVRSGRTDDLPDLEETLMSLHLAVLAARPWPSQAPGTITLWTPTRQPQRLGLSGRMHRACYVRSPGWA
jgi:AcrR family transcriptional regulator